jgi:hypothetical protein
VVNSLINKHIPGIVFIGWVLLLLGILFDDVTTFILFQFGFSIAETNPFFQQFNIYLYYSVKLLIYLFIFLSWYYVNSLSERVEKLKPFYHKLFDVFIFLFCILVVYFFVTKLLLGVANITQMVGYVQDPDMYNDQLEQLHELKLNDPDQYNQLVKETYNETRYLSYYQFLIISLLGFLLFKTGYQTRPWGTDY